MALGRYTNPVLYISSLLLFFSSSRILFVIRIKYSIIQKKDGRDKNEELMGAPRIKRLVLFSYLVYSI